LKTRGTAFYITEDTFDAVPISTLGHLKSEPRSIERTPEMWRRVDETRSLLDRLFLAEFAEKQHGSLGRACLKQPDVEQFGRLRIDSGVQSAALVADPNHRLANRDLIRSRIAVGP